MGRFNIDDILSQLGAPNAKAPVERVPSPKLAHATVGGETAKQTSTTTPRPSTPRPSAPRLDDREAYRPVADMAAARKIRTRIMESLALRNLRDHVLARKHVRLHRQTETGSADRMVDRRARGAVGRVGHCGSPAAEHRQRQPQSLDGVASRETQVVRHERWCGCVHARQS